MRFAFLLVVLPALALMTGCSDSSKDVVVPLGAVPEAQMKVAREQLTDVTFEQTARKKADGTYEIRGKTKRGKIREIEVAPDGKFIIE